MDGRPCWIQKVQGSKDLYIAAQAMKPGEKGFPCVHTLLVIITVNGEIINYSDNELLGHLETGTNESGKQQNSIEWTDGSDVSWIET